MSFEMGKKSSPSLVVREQKKKSNLITSEKKEERLYQFATFLEEDE